MMLVAQIRIALPLLFSFLLAGLVSPAIAQPGCTDPQAVNYQPEATENDGSCQYPPTNYLLQELAVLPPQIDESSGLAFVNGKLWTHNDSGDNAWLYRIDPVTGALLQTVTVINAQNQDWEDLANDDTYVYIGDFGNNPGNRTNLRIFRIPIAGLETGGPVAELIEFYYPDQTDFSVNVNSNNYDCEAFFFLNDSLHLFTKNWVDLQTRHYTIPAQPGMHAAILRDSMPVQGLITAADINEEGHVLLLGYNTFTATSFMWLLFDYPGTEFFLGNKRRINLGSVFFNSQTEGLCFEPGTLGGWVSAEKANVLPQRLFRFSIEPWVTNTPTATQEASSNSSLVNVLQNPASETLHIETLQACSELQLRLLNTNGSVLAYTSLPSVSPAHTFMWPTGVQSPGLYFLQVQCGTFREVHRVVWSY
jgi:hypothetical protein